MKHFFKLNHSEKLWWNLWKDSLRSQVFKRKYLPIILAQCSMREENFSESDYFNSLECSFCFWNVNVNVVWTRFCKPFGPSIKYSMNTVSELFWSYKGDKSSLNVDKRSCKWSGRVKDCNAEQNQSKESL
jgi:hypothetical protein